MNDSEVALRIDVKAPEPDDSRRPVHAAEGAWVMANQVVLGGERSAEDVVSGFRTFKLPPPSFDALKASERELLLYGLPRPPDPATHPVLAERWARIAARRHEFVTPDLRPLPVQRHVDRGLIERLALRDAELARFVEKDRERGRGDLLFDLTTVDWRLTQRPTGLHFDLGDLLRLIPSTSTSWSGGFVTRPASEPITVVSAEWDVPSVSPPPQLGGGWRDGTYLCSAWVGIDGTSGSGDVLQAGTISEVVVSGGGKVTTTNYFAWTEWFSNPWVTVSNFAVSAGDHIACTVCAPFSNTHGSAVFNNLTTGQTTTIGIDPPAGTSLSGNVAEWIVEDPTQSSGALYPFPVYSRTTFTGATAGTKNIQLRPWDGTEIDMVQGGVTLSTGLIPSKTTVVCHYGS